MTTPRTLWPRRPHGALIDWVVKDSCSEPQKWNHAFEMAKQTISFKTHCFVTTNTRALAEEKHSQTKRKRRSVVEQVQNFVGMSVHAATRGNPDMAGAWTAASAAALGLLVFDYAGDILDMPVPAVRLLAASGDPAAALILPAVIVRHGGSDE